MTQDDCNNSHSKIKVGSGTFQSVSGSDGSVLEYDRVLFKGQIEQPIWDAALASADDALVLVQWLESLRT